MYIVVPKVHKWSDFYWRIVGMETRDVEQLEQELTNMTAKTSRLLTDTFELLAPNQNLLSLTVYIPRTEPASWLALGRTTLSPDNSLPKVCSNSTILACLPNALGKMMEIKKLTIGHTTDLCLIEEIAKAVGAEEVVVRFRQDWVRAYDVRPEEWRAWSERGWQRETDAARKRFGRHQVAEEKPKMPI